MFLPVISSGRQLLLLVVCSAALRASLSYTRTELADMLADGMDPSDILVLSQQAGNMAFSDGTSFTTVTVRVLGRTREQ